MVLLSTWNGRYEAPLGIIKTVLDKQGGNNRLRRKYGLVTREYELIAPWRLSARHSEMLNLDAIVLLNKTCTSHVSLFSF